VHVQLLIYVIGKEYLADGTFVEIGFYAAIKIVIYALSIHLSRYYASAHMLSQRQHPYQSSKQWLFDFYPSEVRLVGAGQHGCPQLDILVPRPNPLSTGKNEYLGLAAHRPLQRYSIVVTPRGMTHIRPDGISLILNHFHLLIVRQSDTSF
jgi:hypothetical protein